MNPGGQELLVKARQMLGFGRDGSVQLGGRVATWAAGLALGAAADAVFADPSRHHPVATFGTWAQNVEQRIYKPTRRRGALTWAVLVLPVTAAAWAIDQSLVKRPLARIVFTATCVYFACGAATLQKVTGKIGANLADGDIDTARSWLPWLVGRDPSNLNEQEISRAVIESLAENTSDAYVAPVVWGAIGGPAGVVGYRAINTLDAMFGHRNERFQHFGWWPARVDDVANILPARLTAILTVAGAWVVDGSLVRGWQAWREHAHQHPSPNAGPIEAATAGVLGIQLGGVNNYGGKVENRGSLGWGNPPEAADIGRARTLATWVNVSSTAIALTALVATAVCAKNQSSKTQQSKTQSAKIQPGSLGIASPLEPGRQRLRPSPSPISTKAPHS